MYGSIVGISVAVLVVVGLLACGATGGEPDAEDAELVPQGRSIYVNAADRPMIIGLPRKPGVSTGVSILRWGRLPPGQRRAMATGDGHSGLGHCNSRA